MDNHLCIKSTMLAHIAHYWHYFELSRNMGIIRIVNHLNKDTFTPLNITHRSYLDYMVTIPEGIGQNINMLKWRQTKNSDNQIVDTEMLSPPLLKSLKSFSGVLLKCRPPFPDLLPKRRPFSTKKILCLSAQIHLQFVANPHCQSYKSQILSTIWHSFVDDLT